MWQETVDGLKFTALDPSEVQDVIFRWRSDCGHMADRQIAYYAANGLKMFVQSNRGPVCQRCAVEYVTQLNLTRYRLYAAEDHGTFDTIDDLETAILEMWNLGQIKAGFAFYLIPLSGIRNMGASEFVFGSCRFSIEQIKESIGWERKEPQASRYRLFRYYSSYGRWDVQVIGIKETETFQDTRIYADIYEAYEMLMHIDGLAPMLCTRVAPRNYELERIPNPYGHKVPWLVLKGTKIGMAETAWHSLRPGRLNDDPLSEGFGKPNDKNSFDIDLYYEGDLPAFAIVKK